MKTRTLIAALLLTTVATVAHAQVIETIVQPRDLGLGPNVAIERVVTLDTDPTTQHFVLANYDRDYPVDRALLTLLPDGRVCIGRWSNWFPDDTYAWPTYLEINGLTKVFYQNPEREWVFLALLPPACPVRVPKF